MPVTTSRGWRILLTHTYTYTCIYTHTHTHTHTLSFFLSHTQTHTLSPFPFLSFSLSFTHTHTNTHTLTNTHTDTHSAMPPSPQLFVASLKKTNLLGRAPGGRGAHLRNESTHTHGNDSWRGHTHANSSRHKGDVSGVYCCVFFPCVVCCSVFQHTECAAEYCSV